jgi:heat shock protein HtpX
MSWEATGTPQFGSTNRAVEEFQRSLGYRTTRAQYQALLTRSPQKPGWTRARIALVAISAALLAFDLVLAGLSVELIFGSDNFLVVFLGILLGLIAFELRPRVPRYRPPPGEVTRADAPALFALLDRVSVEIGAPVPVLVTMTSDHNAACGRSGLRRRPFLEIGLPLWAALTPQSKLALLGHEFGHLVNNDPRSSLLIQPALTTFGQLAYLLDPRRMFRGAMPRAIGAVVLWPISRVFWLLHLSAHSLAAVDSQCAEYLADRRSVELAGTSAGAELTDVLLLDDAIVTAVRRAARTSANPTDWRAASNLASFGDNEADPNCEPSAQGRRAREQRSIRRESLLTATHPPSGLRARMLRTWPVYPPRMTLSQAEADCVDAELTSHYARVARVLGSQHV